MHPCFLLARRRASCMWSRHTKKRHSSLDLLMKTLLCATIGLPYCWILVKPYTLILMDPPMVSLNTGRSQEVSRPCCCGPRRRSHLSVCPWFLNSFRLLQHFWKGPEGFLDSVLVFFWRYNGIMGCFSCCFLLEGDFGAGPEGPELVCCVLWHLNVPVRFSIGFLHRVKEWPSRNQVIN